MSPRKPERKPVRPRFSPQQQIGTALVLLVIVAFTAYRYRTTKTAMAHPPAPPVAQPAEPAVAAEQTAPVPAPKINANHAMEYVRDVVAFGPRPVGSTAHKRTEAYILAHLKGVKVETDEFTADTPAGKLPMRNIIAKFPGAKTGVIVIATHYDTLYGRNDFVGANDGGSGTGLLLELANQLRGPGRPGYSVWLVWLDGEEAIREWTVTDSVYGSQHLAAKWQKDGTIKQLKAFLLADMIGDADLSIERDKNSTPWLLDVVYQAATALGFQSHFFRRGQPVSDDHIPFAEAGVPVADLIDFDYGYGNSYWHTSADTMDKLSPRSLEIVGNVLLETTAMLDQR